MDQPGPCHYIKSTYILVTTITNQIRLFLQRMASSLLNTHPITHNGMPMLPNSRHFPQSLIQYMFRLWCVPNPDHQNW